MAFVFCASAVTIVEALSSYINNTGVLLLPAVGTRLILLESFPAPPIPPPASCENHTGVIIIGKALFY
jgi:hypothetical protein